jgi:hypothetical protein
MGNLVGMEDDLTLFPELIAIAKVVDWRTGIKQVVGKDTCAIAKTTRQL